MSVFGGKPFRRYLVRSLPARGRFERYNDSLGGYAKPCVDGRILAGSTPYALNFATRAMGSSIEYLREAALKISPSLGNLEVVETSAGLQPCAAPGLPVLAGSRDIRTTLRRRHTIETSLSLPLCENWETPIMRFRIIKEFSALCGLSRLE